MDRLTKGFSILNGEVAVGVLPTPKTLRIAKALGYAAVLHDCGDGTGTDTVVRGLRERVEAARLEHHTAELAPTGSARDTVLEEVRSLVARLPKPLFVVSADPHRIAALIAAATAPDGLECGQRAGSDQPGKPRRHSRRAA